MKSNTKHMYDLCKSHMHSYVFAQTTDGSSFDGIITGLDDEYVYFAVPVDPNQQAYQEHEDNRQFGFGYPGFGYPGFGYGFGRPPRRFQRLILPLAALAAISILPWY